MINLSLGSWTSYSTSKQSLEKLVPSLAYNSKLKLSSSEKIKLSMKNSQSHHQLKLSQFQLRERKKQKNSHQLRRKKEKRKLQLSNQRTSNGLFPTEIQRTCLNFTWDAKVSTPSTKWKKQLISTQHRVRPSQSASMSSVADSKTLTTQINTYINKWSSQIEKYESQLWTINYELWNIS